MYLAGGGRLGVRQISLEQEQVSFQLNGTTETYRLDIGRVAAILPHQSLHSWRTDDSRSLRVFNHREAEDQIILKNGDQIAGDIDALTDQSLKLGGRELDWKSLLGLRMNPELSELPEDGKERWMVLLVDESWFQASQLTVNATTWNVQLTNTLEMNIPASLVRQIIPISRRQIPLSCYPVDHQEHQPLLGAKSQLAIDRNLLGLPLRRLETREIPSLCPLGLGMTSGMQVQWKLSGRFESLVCEIGMDVVADENADAVVVFLDGDRILKSSPVRAGQPAQSMRLSLTQVDTLTIRVDNGSSADLGDLVDLYHPTLFAVPK